MCILRKLLNFFLKNNFCLVAMVTLAMVLNQNNFFRQSHKKTKSSYSRLFRHTFERHFYLELPETRRHEN